MAYPPVLSGSLPDGGPIELLRLVEQRRVTGTLRFEDASGAAGEVRFYGGEIAVEQAKGADGEDPVDALLSLESGTFELHQELPPLAVSRGTDHERHGSLSVHVPADLMNYCEHAGLSGRLVLTHEGHKAEATYDAGELLAIELDGSDEVDLSEVFGWEQGRFRVILDPSAPEAIAPVLEELEGLEELEEPEGLPDAPLERKPRKGENTRQFLRVVEMALADVTHESEKARDPTRTSPPMPPPPPKRPRPKSVPPPPLRRGADQKTVKLIYLSDDAPPMDEDRSTRHVARRAGSEMALFEARPERRAKSSPEIELDEELMARKKKKKRSAGAPSSVSKASEREPETSEASEPDTSTTATAAGKKAAPKAAAKASDAKASAAQKAAAAEAALEKAAAKEDPRTLGGATAGAIPEKEKTPPGSPLAGFGWALVVVAMGLGILSLLALLPPVRCPPAQENCGWGGCVATSRDVTNCGGCGVVCADGEVCNWGECQAEEEP